MIEYEHWNVASKGTKLATLPVSALNVLIFVIYEAFFMTALDMTIEIIRNVQMRRALKSGYHVMHAPILIWFNKKIETRSIKKGRRERRGFIGWIIFWLYRAGWLYTLSYAIPAAALVYAQLDINSVTAEAITGTVRGHLLYVDLEHFLQTKEPDRQLVEFRKSAHNKKYYKKRSVIDSRIVHYRVYEVDGSPKIGRPCRPGSMIVNSTLFEVRYFDTKEENQHDLGSEPTVRNEQPPSVTSSKNFSTIYCDETYGKLCLAYQTKGKDLNIITGKQAEDKIGLNTTKRHSNRYARIRLDRDWKKGDAETLIQLLLPVVNDRHDDDPVVVIDAVWLLTLRKIRRGRNKIVPEKCELVTMTTMTRPSVIILHVFIGLTVILVIFTCCWKCSHERTVLNESGTTKALLWSYANELAGEPIGWTEAPEVSPRIFVNTTYEEPDHTEPEPVDVRPVHIQTKAHGMSSVSV